VSAPQLFDIKTAAERLQCSRGHVYNLINDGLIPTVAIGRGRAKTRIREQDLDDFIKAATTPARKR
jgi:excisionase family DNA binding protein